MKKLILTTLVFLSMAGYAVASSDPVDPPAPAPVPQNFTVSNNPGDSGTLTLVETDSKGAVRELGPSVSGGFDPALCPCTIEFIQK